MVPTLVRLKGELKWEKYEGPVMALKYFGCIVLSV